MAEDDFVSGKGEDTPRAGTYAIYKDGGDLLVEVIATADEARCVAQEIADDEREAVYIVTPKGEIDEEFTPRR